MPCCEGSQLSLCFLTSPRPLPSPKSGKRKGFVILPWSANSAARAFTTSCCPSPPLQHLACPVLPGDSCTCMHAASPLCRSHEMCGKCCLPPAIRSPKCANKHTWEIPQSNKPPLPPPPNPPHQKRCQGFQVSKLWITLGKGESPVWSGLVSSGLVWSGQRHSLGSQSVA